MLIFTDKLKLATPTRRGIIIITEVSTIKVDIIICSVILIKVVISGAIIILIIDIVIIRIAKIKKSNNLIESPITIKETEVR